MKLLYFCSHQIHNLTPLFRSLAKRKEIKFKVIYWVNISTNHHDPGFNKIINFEVDPLSGYDYYCLFNERKDFLGQFKETIDVSNLSKNVYFIQLKTIDKIYTEKIVVTN